MEHHGMTSDLGSTVIFETYFPYHKNIYGLLIDYYMYLYLIVLSLLTLVIQLK